MAEVLIVTVPGGDRQAWQCPYCSRTYPTMDEEGRAMECPSICRRCNSPMDIAKAQAFQDAEALKADAPIRKRDTVKV